MNLNYVTVEYIPSQIEYQMSKSWNKVIKLYERGGLIVRMILMDVEFEKVAETLGDVEVNIVVAREHVR